MRVSSARTLPSVKPLPCADRQPSARKARAIAGGRRPRACAARMRSSSSAWRESWVVWRTDRTSGCRLLLPPAQRHATSAFSEAPATATSTRSSSSRTISLRSAAVVVVARHKAGMSSARPRIASRSATVRCAGSRARGSAHVPPAARPRRPAPPPSAAPGCGPRAGSPARRRRTAAGRARPVARLLQPQCPLPVPLRPLELDVLGQLQADLDRRGPQHLEHRAGDELVGRASAEGLAARPAAIDLVARALVAQVPPVVAVAGDHAVAAAAAVQDPHQRGGAAPRHALVLAPVRVQPPLVLLAGAPADVGGPAVRQQHAPVLRTPARLPRPAAADPDIRPAGSPPAEHVGAGVGRAGQRVEDGPAVRPPPDDLAARRPAAGAVGQGDAVVDQVAHHAVDAAAALEDVEDEADGVADPLVGIERHLARGPLEVAARQVEAELAPPGLVPAPLLEPGAHDVQLGLAHRALEPEQQPVVVERRVVDAVAVGDQRAGEGADLEQLVPVAAGPGEPRHLEPEHQADVAEPDLGHQALEARPPLGRGAGAAEVVVDDADARPRPARAVGPLGEPVLQRGRLAVLLQLLQRGLADVDDGQPVKVAGLDPARQHQVGPALRRRPHGPPPLPAPGAPSASGAAAPGGRSGRPASGAWSTAARAKAGSPRRSLALPRHTAIQRASASSASALAITSQSTSFAEVLRAGFGPGHEEAGGRAVQLALTGRRCGPVECGAIGDAARGLAVAPAPAARDPSPEYGLVSGSPGFLGFWPVEWRHVAGAG